MVRVSSTSRRIVHRAYKNDSFRRGCGGRSAIRLASRDFETHVDLPRLSMLIWSDLEPLHGFEATIGSVC